MSDSSSKTFDCVQSMRQTRDKISAEIADMSFEELSRWLSLHEYTDPILKRLAERAAQQRAAVKDSTRRR